MPEDRYVVPFSVSPLLGRALQFKVQLHSNSKLFEHELHSSLIVTVFNKSDFENKVIQFEV